MYGRLFEAAFGSEEIVIEHVAKAIASFERTIVSGNSPFDRWQADDKTAMSESAIRGREIFMDNNKGRCSICHAGSNFTDEKFHDIGVGGDNLETFVNDHAGRAARAFRALAGTGQINTLFKLPEGRRSPRERHPWR